MALQLRDYQISPGYLDDFVRAWSTHIRPLREELGFRVVAAWRADDEHRFVWLLSHPGSVAEFEAADAAYYSSPQRTAFDPDPVQWIVKNRTTFVTELD